MARLLSQNSPCSLLLTILVHLDHSSFSAAIEKGFYAGAETGGHTIELAGLYAWKLRPALVIDGHRRQKLWPNS